MTVLKKSIIIDKTIRKQDGGDVMEIKFVKRDVLKEKPDQKNLGFGKYMTDYMFVMDWDKGTG